ncbi:DUF6879 family protein [Nonomuraea sp. NPDC050394]|uniref:DUF6879 family protein n=1 Tax=Nonomuraea sp. NPDC050394 TaxID=3364363 RepID=UPI0037A44758
MITPEQRDALFDNFTRDAFHLELRDEYGVPSETDPITRWQRGEPDDLAWFEPWLERIRRVTAAGRTVRRVRVISEPVSAYIRWEHEIATEPTLAAGEDIRWLPRRALPDGVVWPLDGRDWWLFDDHLLAVGAFDDDGRVLGSELVTVPEIAAACVALRDRLWPLATPHREFKLI